MNFCWDWDSKAHKSPVKSALLCAKSMLHALTQTLKPMYWMQVWIITILHTIPSNSLPLSWWGWVPLRPLVLQVAHLNLLCPFCVRLEAWLWSNLPEAWKQEPCNLYHCRREIWLWLLQSTPEMGHVLHPCFPCTSWEAAWQDSWLSSFHSATFKPLCIQESESCHMLLHCSGLLTVPGSELIPHWSPVVVPSLHHHLSILLNLCLLPALLTSQATLHPSLNGMSYLLTPLHSQPHIWKVYLGLPEYLNTSYPPPAVM